MYCSVSADKTKGEQDRIAAFCDLMNAPFTTNTDKLYIAPLLYQTNPKQKTTNWKNKTSPTDSLQSRRAWAREEFQIHEANNVYCPPSHIATVQFATILHYNEISSFISNFTRKVQTHNLNHPPLATCWTLEVDLGNICHLHYLLRGDVAAFSNLIQSASECSEVPASVTYFKPIDCVQATCRYAVKDINPKKRKKGKKRKKLLLFKKGLRIRTTGSCGNYYHKSKPQLLAEYRARKKDRPKKSTRVAIKFDIILVPSYPGFIPRITSNQTYRPKPPARTRGHPP